MNIQRSLNRGPLVPYGQKPNPPASSKVAENHEQDSFPNKTVRRVLTGAVMGAAGAFALAKLGDGLVSQIRPHYNFTDFVVGTNMVGAGAAMVNPFLSKDPTPILEGYAVGCALGATIQGLYFGLSLASQTNPLAPLALGAIVGGFAASLPNSSNSEIRS